ncbi:MAG TPA: hypothetical protein PKH37_10065, partial [Alphaproteobacteria bacterium]|nr:hypothetical protein [Alphaproteobacteria bacterium]
AMSAGSALADSVASAQAEISALTQQIQAAPQDRDLYNKRSQLYHRIGEHQAALDDLKKNCALEPNPDFQELCNMEVQDYMKIYGVK